jgi:hypothetical protein
MFSRGTMCVVTDINPLKVFKDKKGVVSLSAINDNDDGPWGTWCCNVEGIPVTPEILNKNGFKEEAVGKYYTRSIDNKKTWGLVRYLAVVRERGDWAVFIKYDGLCDQALLREIRHVHELQHILWVLGLDAELKI